jgi:hypothetical protein
MNPVLPVVFPVEVSLDEAFGQNLVRTLESTAVDKLRQQESRNYPGGLEGSDGAQALIVLSTVPKGLAPAVSRAVATAVRTAASPLADHRAR